MHGSHSQRKQVQPTEIKWQAQTKTSIGVSIFHFQRPTGASNGCQNRVNAYITLVDADDFDPEAGFADKTENPEWKGEDEGIDPEVSHKQSLRVYVCVSVGYLHGQY